ncbi:Protein of unknown function [Clostridium cavendishii DSM 21758]|uniref:UPF0473 protein SAMN02745163_02180 n=1 Tax=Clostridium cavendishii DSM 21758 TaxID=1121302 RepID=A0A1M6KF40_9CLOT|nr:DUF1292 domain-containing protein [Clostridium cavendishii]SHJ57563.1 Protein of unknown function [Clostridium cavendishii DSM 21758]
MQNDLSRIVLMDEDNNEIEFNVVTKLEIEGEEYFILSPEGEDDVNIAMKVVLDEEGNEVLASVEDENEIDMIEEAYATLFLDEE